MAFLSCDGRRKIDCQLHPNSRPIHTGRLIRISASRTFPSFLSYSLLRFCIALAGFLPFYFALRLARPLGIFVYRIRKRQRHRALENLRQSFGAEKSEAEIEEIAKGSFVRLLEFVMEWCSMKKWARHPDRYLAVEGVENLHQALLEKKRGAVLLVSHTGNWEIMALIAGIHLGRPVNSSIYALARPLRNPYLYDYSLGMRGLTGLRSIDKTGAVHGTFRQLRQNNIVCMLADQRVSEGAVEVDFFGRPALTTTLPAVAALRFGTPVFFVWLERKPGPRFILHVEPPFETEKTGDINRDIQTNTQRFNNRIEAEIRKNPSRWLWMHNRWRVQHGAKDKKR